MRARRGVAGEPLNTLKLAIVADNYDAGILKNLLFRAKMIVKNGTHKKIGNYGY